MSKTEIEAVMSFLKKGNYLSPAHVTTFICYREKPGLAPQKLLVEIHDFGESNPAGRYMCIMRTEDGRGDSSNPMGSVESAIASVKMVRMN